MRANIRILGIETSCDETAVAIYEGTKTGEGRILADQISSQVNIHAQFGGVVPEIASREHLAVLPGMVESMMQETKFCWFDIDAIAVTAGPGLMGALLVGTSFARAAGLVNNIPLIPIHHLEGHFLAAGLEKDLPSFPFIILLVSGGHTMLIRVEAIGCYRILGQSLDDAAGECFDKTARLIGLGYPGGPAIERLARNGDPDRFSLPRPLLRRDDVNFSFSGLKTAVMHTVKKLIAQKASQDWKQDLAASFQEAVADVLTSKTVRACHQQKISHLIIAGGVAANSRIRESLRIAAGEQGLNIILPSPKYCTDNAAMIAYAGFQRKRLGISEIQTWDARARWPLDQQDAL